MPHASTSAFSIGVIIKNMFFKAKHIPGKYNMVADSLSRLQFQRAREAAPYLDQQPTAIPGHLLQICPQPPKQSYVTR